MPRMLWLNWSGGGNLPPSLGIARALCERGHDVAFAGRPEMVDRVVRAGFRAVELDAAYAQADRYPTGTPLTRMACYLTSPAVEEQIAAVVAREAPDALLIDGMFPAALRATHDASRPRAVFSHTFFFRMLERWRHTVAMLNGMREQAGFSPLPSLDALWSACDRIIVTTAGHLDVPAVPDWDAVRHVGPVLEDEACAVHVPLPWPPGDPTPLVLIALSTAPEQRAPDKLQRSLDALAALDVRIVVTTAGIVSPQELRVPPNAFVIPYAQHDGILRRAALVVTHGGHGTTMRALKHGVPLIVLPGMAHDQALIGDVVAAWGAGIALPGDASPQTIRDSAQRILATPSFAAHAATIANALDGIDGGSNAADEIETMLGTRVSA